MLLLQLQGITAGFADGITTGVEQVCTVSVGLVKHAPANPDAAIIRARCRCQLPQSTRCLNNQSPASSSQGAHADAGRRSYCVFKVNMQRYIAPADVKAARCDQCLLIATAAPWLSCLQLRFDEGFDEASSTHTPEQLPEWSCA
jgi:hypothetical protein